jgi:ABC-2 type transport system permease protein
MRPEAALADRRAGTVVAVTAAKRAVRSSGVWGVLFGLLVMNEEFAYHRNFPTLASRESFAQTFGGNAGLAAVIGPGRRLDTIQGFVAWRMFGLLIIVGAIWGLLLATRLLRGEEDAGRWEVLVAGRTTRRLATVQAIAGLAAGFAVLWAVTAALTLVGGSGKSVGFPVSASLFYATAATASAAMFLAVGAVASQLAPTRRQANGLGAAVFAAFYVIRMIADAGLGVTWLRWASPLGWVENLRPLTGSQPLALVPIGLLTAALVGAAVVLAGRRDVGEGLLAGQEAAKADTRLLGGSGALVVRLERWVTLSWIAGLAALALLFGVVARTAAKTSVGVGSIEQAVARLGGHHGGAVTAWIGYEFLFIAALVAFAAAGQISALHIEEAEGHLDNLLARRVGRTSWLAGRLGVAVALVVLLGLAVGIGGWIGAATRGGGVGFASMMQAGLNVAVPALFILGAGTLMYGIAPRLAAPALYSLVLWSFVIEIVGSTITADHWLLDTAVLSHLGPVPAAGLDWTAIAWLTGLAAIAALIGLAAFNRRDLATA